MEEDEMDEVMAGRIDLEGEQPLVRLTSERLQRIDDYTGKSATVRSWRTLAILSTSLLLLGVLSLAVKFAPPAVSQHVPPQLFAALSILSFASSTLPAPSAVEYDPFYRIAPATSTYASHVCLLEYSGRWGNHAYKINNALYIALKHNLTLHLPPSPGDQSVLPHLHRFTAPCPNELPEIHRNDLWWQRINDSYWDTDPHAMMENHNYTALRLTLGGYMQYPTWAHASRRADIRAFYAPDAELRELMDRIKGAVMSEYCSDSIVVAIHIRAGDFPKAEQWNYTSNVLGPLQIPVTWYISYLRSLITHNASYLQQLKQWQDADCPHSPAPLNLTSPFSVFLASEDMTNAATLREAGFRTMSLAEAVVITPGLGRWASLNGPVGTFWAEWWLLSQFRALMTSHSSFSITAALQSPYYETQQALYVTPDPETLAMQRFDPWNVSYDAAAFTNRGKRVVFS